MSLGHISLDHITSDLLAEHEALDGVVQALGAAQWRRETPSAGWTVADQLAHLTYFDRAAVQAITDPEQFRTDRDALYSHERDEPTSFDELTLGEFRAMTPQALLASWRERRAALIAAACALSDGARIDWYGPSMSARSFLTARQMETWAHGQDIVDTVAGHRPPTDRLRNIAQLGVITRRWSYSVRLLPVPSEEVRVELEAPSGATWTWGPIAAGNLVTGPAEDFCMVVTQRRHVTDTALQVVGEQARDWMLRAQAFAGGPTDGPAAGSFPPSATHGIETPLA